MSELIERIHRFDAGLLKTQLKMKYKIMAQSPVRFFRGTASLFYEDLRMNSKLPASPICWLCGDMHIENFGSFKGDDKLVYFDINDFDEALLGPVLWDLLRAVTSIYVAFGSLDIPMTEAKRAAKMFIQHYSAVLREGKARYVDANTATGVVEYFLKKTRKRNQDDLLHEIAKDKKGTMVIRKDGKKMCKVQKDLKKELYTTFHAWMISNNEPPNHFKVLDVCFQASGTGSLGAKRFLFLIQKIRDKRKLRLIEMKQATASAGIHYVKTPQPGWASDAQRIVAIQKRMQYASPAQLSTVNFQGDTFVMQQMQPTTDKVDFTLIKNKFGDLSSVMRDMALLTASAHLRSVSREGSCSADELIAFGNELSHHEGEILKYTRRYARRTKDYYKTFVKEYK